MSDSYIPPQPQAYTPPEPQVYPPVEAQPQPQPPAATDTPIGQAPPDGTPFATAFPNADEASVQAAEAAFKDGTAEGVVVNPGPQIGDTAPDQSTEPAMPPPPVNP